MTTKNTATESTTTGGFPLKEVLPKLRPDYLMMVTLPGGAEVWIDYLTIHRITGDAPNAAIVLLDAEGNISPDWLLTSDHPDILRERANICYRGDRVNNPARKS